MPHTLASLEFDDLMNVGFKDVSFVQNELDDLLSMFSLLIYL